MKRSLTRRAFVTRLGGAAFGLTAVEYLGEPFWAGRRLPSARWIGAEVPTAWYDLVLRTRPASSPPDNGLEQGQRIGRAVSALRLHD